MCRDLLLLSSKKHTQDFTQRQHIIQYMIIISLLGTVAQVQSVVLNSRPLGQSLSVFFINQVSFLTDLGWILNLRSFQIVHFVLKHTNVRVLAQTANRYSVCRAGVLLLSSLLWNSTRRKFLARFSHEAPIYFTCLHSKKFVKIYHFSCFLQSHY